MPKATSEAPRLTVITGDTQPAKEPPKPRSEWGAGTAYKGSDGRIRAAMWIVDPLTSRRRRLSREGATKREARDRLRSAIEDLERQAKERDSVAARGPLLAEFVARWLPELRNRVRPSTWIYREEHWRIHLKEKLGQVPLVDLTPAHVERLLRAMLDRGLSPTTARGVRTTLGMILRDAEREALVNRNAARLSRPPRVVRHELNVLTAEQTRRLMTGAADHEFGPAFALAATTGLRLGELLGLAWADVDLDGRHPTLTVRRSLAKAGGTDWTLSEPKTPRSRRTLELAPPAVVALRSQRDRQTAAREAAGDLWQDRDDLVFSDELGRSLRPWTVSASFVAALARLGLPRVRFHDLRHGVASMLLAQGVPLKLVSDALGHSTLSVTADTYAHLDREQRRAAASAIDRALGGEG